MKKFWIVMAVCALVGCGDSFMGPSWTVGTVKNRPLEVKVVNAPDEARIKALEARVTTIEDWATKRGGRIK